MGFIFWGHDEATDLKKRSFILKNPNKFYSFESFHDYIKTNYKSVGVYFAEIYKEEGATRIPDSPGQYTGTWEAIEIYAYETFAIQYATQTDRIILASRRMYSNWNAWYTFNNTPI